MLLTVKVDDRVIGKKELPSGEHFVGRSEGSCVPLDEEWVSRTQLNIQRQSDGWVVTNGYRTRMRASSSSVEAMVAPGGSLLVHPGEPLELSWPELPHNLTMTLTSFGRRRQLGGQRPRPGHGTLLPFSRQKGRLSRLQFWRHRERLAILFRHLLLGQPRPSNLYTEAAQRSGVSEATLRQLVRRLLLDINDGRAQPLQGVDALGHYLVETTGELRLEHLPDEQQASDDVSRA